MLLLVVVVVLLQLLVVLVVVLLALGLLLLLCSRLGCRRGLGQPVQQQAGGSSWCEQKSPCAYIFVVKAGFLANH
jgi:hypothetical protein